MKVAFLALLEKYFYKMISEQSEEIFRNSALCTLHSAFCTKERISVCIRLYTENGDPRISIRSAVRSILPIFLNTRPSAVFFAMPIFSAARAERVRPPARRSFRALSTARTRKTAIPAASAPPAVPSSTAPRQTFSKWMRHRTTRSTTSATSSTRSFILPQT